MAEKIDMYASDGSVKIKANAYITMIKHVLSYGNEGLGGNSVEVMGICMGKQVGNDMVVFDAIPVSHGGAIEVGFTPADYAAFAQVDEEYAEKGNGLYACGWYHSHPNMKAFFSGTDIKNHLFYQKEQTPKGFGLVFDHQYFDEPGNLGFKCFRLNDYRKGTSSDFHECKVQVLVPEDSNAYRETMKIIEAYQSKQPFIKEIGGLDVDDSVWGAGDEEGGEPEAEEKVEEVKAKEPIDDVTKGLDLGTQIFTEEFMKLFFKKFSEFANDTSKATQKGGDIMIDTVVNMKENVESGIERIKKYLEKMLNDEVNGVQVSVEDMFKKFDEDQNEFAKKFDAFTAKVSTDIGTVIKNLLSEKLGSLISIFKQSAQDADAIGGKTQNFKVALDSQQKVLEQLKTSLEKDTGTINEAVQVIKNKLGDEAKERSKQITSAISDLKAQTEDISKLIAELQKKIAK
jgi:proteasome lid subunit RPN8/RPN11